jgi:hypothetical protein
MMGRVMGMRGFMVGIGIGIDKGYEPRPEVHAGCTSLIVAVLATVSDSGIHRAAG